MENVYAVPVSHAEETERAAFLRQVGGLTLLGLVIAGVASVGSMFAVATIEALQHPYAALAIMLGGVFGARWVGSTLVVNPESQVGGFVLGTALQGLAMGYLLLAAVVASQELYADPFLMIGQALGLVGLTVFGMVAYLMTGPKNLSILGGTLSALSLPMLGLMMLSFVFPINGTIGILVSLVFVGMSAGGLVYNLNQVMHQMSTKMVWPAAYHVALGVLILFWNVLTLLLRLSRRR